MAGRMNDKTETGLLGVVLLRSSPIALDPERKVVHREEPQYPALAGKMALHGTAKLKIWISPGAAVLQAGCELPRRSRRAQRFLRRARVRHVRSPDRHGSPWRPGLLRLNLLLLRRLLQTGHPPGCAHGGPLPLRLYPRLPRTGPGRPHAPAAEKRGAPPREPDNIRISLVSGVVYWHCGTENGDRFAFDSRNHPNA